MPLATVRTLRGEAVRVRYLIHTPWTPGHEAGAAVPAHPATQDGGHAGGLGYRPPAATGARHDAAADSGRRIQAEESRSGSKAVPEQSEQLVGRQTAAGSAVSCALQHKEQAAGAPSPPQQHSRQQLLIIANPGSGISGGTGWFSHVADHFAALRHPGGEPAADVVTFDNRRRWGADGQPPPREGRSGYSTEAMAADALGLMDALGWRQAHLVGMSLGAMVAAKLAAAAPHRVGSLTLLGYAQNGWQMAASLVSRPDWLAQVLIGTRVSKVRASLPFYFTRRFLDVPHQPQTPQLCHGQTPDVEAPAERSAQQAAAQQAARTAPLHIGSDDASVATSSSAGDAPSSQSATARHLEALLNRRRRRRRSTPTRGDAILQQAMLRAEIEPQAVASTRAADSGASGLSSAASREEAEEAAPDTRLKSHSVACLFHWLSSAEAAAIADAPFTKTLMVGRHDPVVRQRWAQGTAAALRCTLLVTEASHAGLPVESCQELLSRLELAVFGRSLSDAHTWRAVQDAAIEDATSNPYLVKR